VNPRDKVTIVLAHGLIGLGDVRVGRMRFSYFHRIDEAIAGRGFRVVAPRVHPTASIARRAAQLRDGVTAAAPSGPLVVLAHSMGGLDARYMISRLGLADRVRALVTICTPHRGSAFADWCLSNVGERLGALAVARRMGLDLGAMRDLTLAGCAAFNREVADVPGVAYLSITAARAWKLMPLPFVLSHRVIQNIEGDNDGLVSVASGQWGEHLGTWPIDHLASINKRMIAARLGERFDVLGGYGTLLDTLAGRGLLD
jgi:triacylglycerol lipase